VEWPSWSWTTFRSVPAASASVAAPCRSPCKVTGGSPDPATSVRNIRLETEDPPLLAQIRSDAFSTRVITILHSIERNTAQPAETRAVSLLGSQGAMIGDRNTQVNNFYFARGNPGLPVGRMLAEITDPFALEVHRPVQLADLQPGLPKLPAYLPRGHDRELADVVRAAAGGTSGSASAR